MCVCPRGMLMMRWEISRLFGFKFGPCPPPSFTTLQQQQAATLEGFPTFIAQLNTPSHTSTLLYYNSSTSLRKFLNSTSSSAHTYLLFNLCYYYILTSHTHKHKNTHLCLLYPTNNYTQTNTKFLPFFQFLPLPFLPPPSLPLSIFSSHLFLIYVNM